MKTILIQLALILISHSLFSQDLPIETKPSIENLVPSIRDLSNNDKDFQNHIFYMKAGIRLASTEFDFKSTDGQTLESVYLLNRLGNAKRSNGYTFELGNIFSVIKFSEHFRIGLDATYVSISIDPFDSNNQNEVTISPYVTWGAKLGPSFLLHLNKQISIYGGYKYHANAAFNFQLEEKFNNTTTSMLKSNFGGSKYHSLNINIDFQVISFGAYYEVGTTTYNNMEFTFISNGNETVKSHNVKSKQATLTIFAALAF